MSRKTGIHARFLLLSSSLILTTVPSLAQNLRGQDKVVSVVPELSRGSIVISTDSKNPLPAPQIQYLPGPDGKTLLVADFVGVEYGLQTHLLKPASSAADAWRQNGLQEIRIGQFSAQPPTMRISISAYNALAFRALSFQARPGALVMKWNPGNQVASNSTYERNNPTPGDLSKAPVAPDYRKSVSVSPAASQVAKNYSGREVGQRSLRSAEALPERNQWQSDGAVSATPKSKSSKSQSSSILYKSTGANLKETQPEEKKSPSAVARWLKKFSPSNLDAKEQVAEKPFERVAESPINVLPKTAPALELAKKNPSELFKKSTPEMVRKPTDFKPLTEALDTSLDAPKISSDTYNAAEQRIVTISLNDANPQENNGAADIVIKADKKLTYKTFRLHDPERYVIDFDALSELNDAEVPSVQENLLVKSMRTGTPDDTGTTNRLVLDLKDATVDVSDVLTDNGTGLNLKIRPAMAFPNRAFLIRDKTIVLDAGHGGTDPGAQRSGIQEKELTFQITNQLRKRLMAMGAKVIMTRSDDSFVSLEDRVKITNASQADLFVSIHINALESSSAIYGVETYYQTEQSRSLATAIHKQLVDGLAVPDRNVRKARFYVINHTAVPAILAEVGYISNPKERDNLGTTEYQVKISDAVSTGIVQYLTEKQELAGKTVKPSL